MKTFLVFLVLAIVAMASAQRVKVVEHNPEQVHVVENNPDAVQVVDNNPSSVHVVDNNPGAVQVVDINPNPSPVNFVDNNGQPVNVVNNRPTRPGQGGFVINNPDPFFGQPSRPPNNNGGYEPISVGPTFVNNRPNNYPPKQYDNPFARGGK